MRFAEALSAASTPASDLNSVRESVNQGKGATFLLNLSRPISCYEPRSADQILHHRCEFDWTITLHTVTGALDDPHVNPGLTFTCFGNVVVINDR